MARGLSDTQKSILKVISDLPEGSELYNEVYSVLKATLYPELYGISPSPLLNGSYCRVKFIGWNIRKKNNARVVISKSFRRLEKRGYLIIKNESKKKYFPEFAFKGKKSPMKIMRVDIVSVYLTQSGRQIVNG